MKKQLDFFSRYHTYRLRQWLLSGSFAFMIAFFGIAVSNDSIDTYGLMASVSELQNTQNQADVIFERKGTDISISFTHPAKKVHSLYFVVLGDPSEIKNISSQNPDIRIEKDTETGAYRVSIDLHDENINPNTQIGSLHIDMRDEAALAITDTVFMSQGQEYSLSNMMK